MRIYVYLLFLLVMFPIQSIAQDSLRNEYPKKLIIDKDTLVGITISQMTKINIAFEERNLLKQERSLLTEKLNLTERKSSELRSQIMMKDSMILNYHNQITNYEGIMEQQSKALEKAAKKIDRANKVAWTVGGVCIGVGLAGLLIGALK